MASGRRVGQRPDCHTFLCKFWHFQIAVSQWKLAWLTPNLGILRISVSSFWLCESIVANPIIYRLVPRPSRFETRQYANLQNLSVDQENWQNVTMQPCKPQVARPWARRRKILISQSLLRSARSIATKCYFSISKYSSKDRWRREIPFPFYNCSSHSQWLNPSPSE